MRVTSAAIAILIVCLGGTDSVASNALTTFPLHAIHVDGDAECEVEPEPCSDDPFLPVIQVATGDRIAICLLVRNYEEVAGLQTAFDWGDWQFLRGQWDCRPNQVVSNTPEHPGGPEHGTISTAFDCIEGGETAVIGFMYFLAGTDCLTQLESSHVGGTHVLDGDLSTATAVQAIAWGAICSGPGGYDACEPVVPFAGLGTFVNGSPLVALAQSVECVVPVETTRWGMIKSVYR
jgi:hypothetical protein